ncbi:MAG: hypothetical protein KKF50_03065 [Nanoarchaeota archaeon]|nr:hypothetical protein [Nanoarchaeota archaeon]
MVKGKGGAAHFEMIISFIFFIGFVFFLFLFLKPYDTTVLSGSVVSALYDTFEEEVHTNLTSLFLKANATDVVESCFYVQLVDDIFIYTLTESRVTNLAGDVRDSNLEAGQLNMETDGTVHYKVAISPEFEAGDLSGCTLLPNYYLGSNSGRRVISNKALEEMKSRYEIDYENLKVDLKVPEAFEFFIISEDIGLEMKHFVPSSVTNVNTYDYVLEVVNSTGGIVNARFTLGVW